MAYSRANFTFFNFNTNLLFFFHYVRRRLYFRNKFSSITGVFSKNLRIILYYDHYIFTAVTGNSKLSRFVTIPVHTVQILH
jgi:hypothetical protein